VQKIPLEAIRKAEKLRIQLGVKSSEIVDVFDICSNLDIMVRYTSISMEGMYIQGETNNTILISNCRPIPRRIFTCAHELGHHVFNHGSQLDANFNEQSYTPEQLIEEQLVNIFAGALLIPISRIYKEINLRKWLIPDLTSMNCFILSSLFGVGYQTIITNLKINKVISNSKATVLGTHTPKSILKSVYPNVVSLSHTKIFDAYCQPSFVELEEGNYLIVNSELYNTSKYLELLECSKFGFIYKAINSGVFVRNLNDNNTQFRVSKKGYEGLINYRIKDDND